MIRQFSFLVSIFISINSLSFKSAYGVLDMSDEGATISCTCGKVNVKKEITFEKVADILESIVKSNLTSSSLLYYPKIIREHFLKCSMCKISISKCMGRPNSERYKCRESSAEFVIDKNRSVYPEYRDMMNYAVNTSYLREYDGSPAIHIQNRNTVEYPIYDYIPIGGLNKTRIKRQGKRCTYPTTLQTSDLKCTLYPSKVRCLQRCAFGYTLREGRNLRFKCKKKNNKWHPRNFEECQPYVDCGISLVSGGKAKCKSPTLTKGPVCSVSCMAFEDRDEVSAREHKCNTRGKWDPYLPFCAVPGSGLYLVQAPKEE